jgi:hypothetical protein
MEHFGIFKLSGESIVDVDIALGIGVFGVEFFGKLLIVPKSGLRNLNLKFAKSISLSLNLEIDLGLTESSTHILQIICEIAHDSLSWCRGTS